MRITGGIAIFALIATAAFGQTRGQQYGSITGFGNILYPGTGHAPAHPPGGVSQLSNGYPLGRLGSLYGPSTRYRPVHPRHGASSIVAVPVYVGGYGYGYDPGYAAGAYPPAEAPPVDANAAPSVVINQNFIPERATPVVREYGPATQRGNTSESQSSGLKMYEAPSHPYVDQQATAVQEQQPTIYLIAFRDHNIVPALGYWTEGSTLHYVTVDHDMNQASLELIDRDLSKQLNAERGVEFKLR